MDKACEALYNIEINNAFELVTLLLIVHVWPSSFQESDRRSLSPIFSIFLPFPSPPFFTDRSFAPRKAQRSLAQEILIFRGAEGARPLCEPW